jgi:mannosyl-3-phosphoglycerate phosphatase
MRSDLRDLVVVTDLAGTLLDRHTGSWAAAQPALQRLAELDIPVVFNSSKTAATMLQLRQQLDNRHPFISENGAQLCLPDAGSPGGLDVRSFGMPRNHILHELAGIAGQGHFDYLAFSAMTLEQLAPVTGLGRNLLHALMQRLYTEILLWQDSAQSLQQFAVALAERGLRAQGLQTLHNGRLLQVSVPVDKATPLPALRDWYQLQGRAAPCIVALGDGHNDVPLLEAADIAICIRAGERPFPAVNKPQCRYSALPGPQGWNEELLQLLAAS